jgi:hypothetical protein
MVTKGASRNDVLFITILDINVSVLPFLIFHINVSVLPFLVFPHCFSYQFLWLNIDGFIYKLCHCCFSIFSQIQLKPHTFSIIYCTHKISCSFCLYCKTTITLLPITFLLIQHYMAHWQKIHCVQLLFSFIMFFIAITLLKIHNKSTYTNKI